MTLSKAEWQKVRPERLKALGVGKLMEALKTKPGESIKDWQTCLKNCEELKEILATTPKILTSHNTPEYRAAMVTWAGDIRALEQGGERALKVLFDEKIDDFCTEHGKDVERDTRNLIKYIETKIKDEKKGKKDPRGYARLIAEVAQVTTKIRDLRKDNMESVLKRTNSEAKAIYGDKLWDKSKFKMSVDPMLIALIKDLNEIRLEYQKAVEAG